MRVLAAKGARVPRGRYSESQGTDIVTAFTHFYIYMVGHFYSNTYNSNLRPSQLPEQHHRLVHLHGKAMLVVRRMRPH